MKKTLRATALCMALVSALAFAGCKKTLNVARVGKESITYDEYLDLVTNYTSMYGVTPETLDDVLGVTEANNFREQMVQELVNEKIMLQKGKEMGLDTMSAEDEAEIEQNKEAFYTQVKEQFLTEVLEEGIDDSKAEAEAQKRMDEEMKQLGITEKYVLNYYKESIILDRVYAKVIEGIAVSESDMQATYDSLLADQKALAEEDADEAIYYYVNGYNEVNVYIPQGMRYVKHILIAIPDDVRSTISAMTDEDEKANALEAALQDISARAQAALAEVEEGKDFDLLMAKYGDDPGMQAEPAMTEGYQLYEGSNMAEEFEQAGMALKNVGDVTGLVPTIFGYHIIKYVSEITPGAVELDDVRADLEVLARQEQESMVWEDTLAMWKDEMEIVYYPENYLSPLPAGTEDAGEE